MEHTLVFRKDLYMGKVFIVSAKRTPIGKFGGKLSTNSASDLGALVIKEVVKQANIDSKHISQVIMGNVLQAGKGQNPARQAALKANLSNTIPAITINDVCGSGLSSINMAAALIKSGQAKVVIAGGMESMTNASYSVDQARFGYRMGDGVLNDTILSDALTDSFGGYHMGITAENIAKKYNISRQEMDIFALNSHKKAICAIENGKFNSEIIPVLVKDKYSQEYIEKDEAPRADTNIQKLSKLRPSFDDNGTVTPGNSSGINDGAAAVLLVDEQTVISQNLHPLAEWIDSSIVGLDPNYMGLGPYYAVTNLISKLKETSLKDIDIFELNEAFSAQAIACNQLLNITDGRVNPNGGAIALGHPVGASGARILVSLIYELINSGNHNGIASLCVGGGMGVATAIRR